MTTPPRNGGQALIEFAIGALLMGGALIGAGRLLQAEWDRLRSCVLSFQKAHDRLTGRTADFAPHAPVREQARFGRCLETVSLRRLEDQSGSLQLPWAIGLCLIVMAGLGAHGLLRSWRGQVELQYRLDACVAKTTYELRHQLVLLELDNRALKAARLAAAAGIAAPPVVAAAQATAQALVLHQETLRASWELQRLAWAAQGACDSRHGDRGPPWSAIPVIRDPPDTLGPGLLRWTEAQGPRFRLQASHSPRSAVAWIEGDSNDRTRWKVRWGSPEEPFRAGFP